MTSYRAFANGRSTPGPAAISSWNTRECASNDRSRLLSGSVIRAPSQMRSRKATSSDRSAALRGCGATARAASSHSSASPWSTRVEWMSKMTPSIVPGVGQSWGTELIGEAYCSCRGPLGHRIALPVVTTEAADAALAEPDDDLPEQMRIRREKREQLAGKGMEPYADRPADHHDDRCRACGTPRPARGHRDRRAGRDRRSRHLLPQLREAVLRHPASRRRLGDPGDGVPGQCRRAAARGLEGARRPRRPRVRRRRGDHLQAG